RVRPPAGTMRSCSPAPGALRRGVRRRRTAVVGRRRETRGEASRRGHPRLGGRARNTRVGSRGRPRGGPGETKTVDGFEVRAVLLDSADFDLEPRLLRTEAQVVKRAPRAAREEIVSVAAPPALGQGSARTSAAARDEKGLSVAEEALVAGDVGGETGGV